MYLKKGTSLCDGKYIIERMLGQGGFGITYLATQFFLKRQVAVKEFFMKDCCDRDPDSSTVTSGTGTQGRIVEKFRGKFVREAQAIASMNHPNIVHVMDVFEENGTAYYVMENLPGGSLADKVKREGPLPESEVERYIRQIAEALEYVHSRNMVHLDVKPSNILLNEQGDAILIDFGISKHYDNAGEQTSSTPVGISKGFAPLEQSSYLDVSQFAPSTDIYSLGATVYSLLTGSIPPEASSVLEEGLPRPSGMSDRFWNVVERAMQPRRKDRPQSIREFLGLLDGKPAAGPALAGHKPTLAAAPVLAGNSDEETRVISASSSAAWKQSRDYPGSSSKSTMNWLWAFLAGAVLAAAVVAVVIGIGKKETTPPVPPEDQYEWVDMGLSVKWAACNLGANRPEQVGGYYAWGEVSPKSNYSWGTYKWCNGGEFSLTKYCNYPGYGSVDNRTSLDPADDAAHVKMGGSWRMPTQAELLELLNNCDRQWTFNYNGTNVAGAILTSRINGNSIFLPAGGDKRDTGLYDTAFGGYWSSDLIKYLPSCAFAITVGYNFLKYEDDDRRYIGQSIRPVRK